MSGRHRRRNKARRPRLKPKSCQKRTQYVPVDLGGQDRLRNRVPPNGRSTAERQGKPMWLAAPPSAVRRIRCGSEWKYPCGRNHNLRLWAEISPAHTSVAIVVVAVVAVPLTAAAAAGRDIRLYAR